MEPWNTIDTSCPNCGATVTKEICPYCNASTGIKYREVEESKTNEPIIDCKEANISFWGIIFPLIFAVAFGFFGFGMPLIFLMSDTDDIGVVILICSMFAIVSVVATIIILKNIIRFLLIKIKGEEINALVQGYMDDNLIINNEPAQVIKLRIDTSEGPKIALYQTKDVKRPYNINQPIKLKKYKDIYYLSPNQNNI